MAGGRGGWLGWLVDGVWGGWLGWLVDGLAGWLVGLVGWLGCLGWQVELARAIGFDMRTRACTLRSAQENLGFRPEPRFF